MSIKEEYEKLLINCPENGENPFEYSGSDKPYFLYLTNRNMNCSKLFNTDLIERGKLDTLLDKLGGDQKPLTPGYTNLDLVERQFVLYMGEVDYSDIYRKNLKDSLLFSNDKISEDDCVADMLIFVYREHKKDNVRTTSAAWKYNPDIIKALTGKDKYSINDAKIIIKSMRNGDSCVYACIGVKVLYSAFWH